MFGFAKHGPDGRCGLVLDIGSASATLAIVVSDPTTPTPTIVWSTQERCPVAAGHDATQIAKLLSSAVVNVMLTFGAEGQKTLREYDPKAVCESLHVSVSAPWSYTVTKTVSSSNEETFEITKTLMEELIKVAEEQALEIIDTNNLLAKLGLEVIARSTANITANGYTTTDPIGQTVDKLTISQLIGVSQQQILDVVRESHEKILPRSTITTSTFMLNFYQLLTNLEPDTAEICLVDITGEATELGVVRDGILRFVTHIPQGHYSLARAIATATSQPFEEVLGALKHDSETYLSQVPATHIEAVNICISDYITAVNDLFGRTGDTLAIPNTLFLHTDSGYEPLFTELIAQAAATSTKSDHVVHGVTKKFFADATTDATKTLVSASVFHKNTA